MLTQITSLAMIAIVIVSVLSILLFLSDSQIKYHLFIFGVTLTGIFVIVSFRSDLKIKRVTSSSYVKIVDYFLVGSAVVVFVDNALSSPPISIIFALSVILSFFLPGWVLIRLLGVSDKKTFNFHFLLISFSASIGLTSLILLPTIPFKENAITVLSGTYVVISLLPLLKNSLQKLKEKQKSSFKPENRHSLVDILILVWVTLFFAFVIFSLYPQMAYVPGLDIVRHYSDSKALIQTTDIYSSQYPWFHSALAMLNQLSSPPIWLFQSGIAFLSIILIFSFYIMAKAYLSEINRRAHLVATIFFFVFSGFGWFYIIQQKLSLVNTNSYLDILKKSYDVTYWDVGYGQGGWLWLWFRPITLGFTIFFTLLYLMKAEDLGKRSYIIIVSLLLLTLGQVHFSELLIFVVLIFVLSLLRPTIKLRIFETAISILVSLGATLLLTIAYHQFLGWQYQPFTFQYLALSALLACLICFLVKYSKRPRMHLRINLTLVSSTILFVFSVFLMYWFLNPENLSVPDFYKIYAVPWEFYPILLGVVGIIAIFGSVLAVKKYANQPIMIFVILLVLAVVIGRAITYVNANFVDSGYFERRLIPFVGVASSILASIAVVTLMKWQKKNTHYSRLKNFVIGIFLSFLVLSGLLSTFFTIEYQSLTLPVRSLTSDKIKLESHLSRSDPYSILLTVTNSSRSIAEFENLGYIVDLFRYQLWTSKSPELTLNVFSSLNSSTFIFLDHRDSKIVASKYNDGYIASHIMKIAPITYEGPEGKILLFPRVSPPSSHSDDVLVLPDDQNRIYYAYDILSLGGYNYTTALESDINFISKARIVVVTNEDIALKMIHYREQNNTHFEKLVVLDLNGNSSRLASTLAISNTTKIAEGYDLSSWSKNYNDFEIFYLDVSSMIQKLNAGTADAQQIFLSLTKSVEMRDIKFPVYNVTNRNEVSSLVSGGVATFKNATFNGVLVLKSASAIVNVDSSYLTIKSDGNSSNFNNVSKIIPINTDETVIKSQEGIISSGEGFYARVLLNQSSIQLAGHPTTLLLIYQNGNTTTLSGNEIEISSEKLDMLIRQPRVESDGVTKFENFYAYGELNQKLGALNERLLVNGKVSYDSQYSDIFTIAHNSSFAGEISHSVQVLAFDELGSLENIFTVQNLPYMLIIALVIILGNVIVYHRKIIFNTWVFSERGSLNVLNKSH